MWFSVIVFHVWTRARKCFKPDEKPAAKVFLTYCSVQTQAEKVEHVVGWVKK